jgi:MYXO-CTERM domain-containing protein
MIARVTAVALLVVGLTAAHRAEANDGQWPEIYELVQQGQDVEITLSLWPSEGTEINWDCYPGDPFDNDANVIRRAEGTDEYLVVLEEYRLTEELEPTGQSPRYCHEPDVEFCAANDCEDCDGDEVPECPDLCCYKDLYTVVDECVPPGLYVYQSVDDLGSLDLVNQESIEVVDAGTDECDPADGGDADEDSGEDCGCSAPGGTALNPLALVMLALGIAAILIDRRRRQR